MTLLDHTAKHYRSGSQTFSPVKHYNLFIGLAHWISSCLFQVYSVTHARFYYCAYQDLEKIVCQAQTPISTDPKMFGLYPYAINHRKSDLIDNFSNSHPILTKKVSTFRRSSITNIIIFILFDEL